MPTSDMSTYYYNAVSFTNIRGMLWPLMFLFQEHNSSMSRFQNYVSTNQLCPDITFMCTSKNIDSYPGIILNYRTTSLNKKKTMCLEVYFCKYCYQ